ncbi:hypothetical protein ACFCYH_13615, partial [Streptomyces sp. NPDC056400]
RDGLPSLRAGLPDPGSRTVRVLHADAGAMAVVARRSIAAGDHGRRGTRLASRLASTWRDREEEAFALLVSALPYGHGDTFGHLGELLPYVRHADRPGIAAEVLPHARDTDHYRSRSARMFLGQLGDERVEGLLPDHEPGAVPDSEDDADVLGELAVATGRLDLWRSVLRSSHLREANRALDALSPAVTGELRPELVALLRARKHVWAAATALAEAGAAAPDVMAALTEISREPDGYEPPADAHNSWDVWARQDRGTARTGNQIAAAVALARLGGPSEPALALLAQGPVGCSPWPGTSARDLGPAGRPLLPRIEAALEEPAPATRLWAAEVHRRITRGPYARCVPVLTDLVRTRPCDEAHRAAPLPAALAALAELGVTPHGIRPHLRTWADSERRIIPCYGRHGPLDDDVLREAARAHLSLLGDR